MDGWESSPPCARSLIGTCVSHYLNTLGSQHSLSMCVHLCLCVCEKERWLMIKRNRGGRGGVFLVSIKLRKCRESGFIFSEKRLVGFEKRWEAPWWQTFYQNFKKPLSLLPLLSHTHAHAHTHTHTLLRQRQAAAVGLVPSELCVVDSAEGLGADSSDTAPLFSPLLSLPVPPPGVFVHGRSQSCPASLAASQAQLEKMQAVWWMDAVTVGQRDIRVSQYWPWSH